MSDYSSIKPQMNRLYDERKPTKPESHKLHLAYPEPETDEELLQAEKDAREFIERRRVGARRSSFDGEAATESEKQAHADALDYARRRKAS